MSTTLPGLMTIRVATPLMSQRMSTRLAEMLSMAPVSGRFPVPAMRKLILVPFSCSFWSVSSKALSFLFCVRLRDVVFLNRLQERLLRSLRQRGVSQLGEGDGLDRFQ